MPDYNRGFLYNRGARYKLAAAPVVPTLGKKGRRFMAGNPVPKDDDELEGMASKIATGLHLLATPLGILGTNEAMVTTAITACQAAVAAAGVAKDEKQAASDALQLVDDNTIAYLGASRNVLAHFLGNRWSASWEPTGFPDMSTAVPQTQTKRLSLCAQLAVYFTANPTREVASLGVTAAQAQTFHTALKAGNDLLDQKLTALDARLKDRDAAYRALSKIVRAFISDLRKFLPDDDGRWYTFGLNAPADPVTPAEVVSLTLTNGLAHQIVAAWPRAPRATRYRPFVQIVGVDADPVARDPVHDLTVTLDSFTSGQTVKVYITAANDDGEANPSPIKQIVVA